MATSLHIPPSKSTVSVSVINTTTHVKGLPAAAFMSPQIPGLVLLDDGCSYAFLIRRTNSDSPTKHDTLLFDLGTRKDPENGPTALVEQMAAAGVAFSVEKNVADILREHGDDPAEIGAIIWSHYHTDHTGDPTTFPKSTDLIVGPGFKQAFVPGWPTKADSPVDERAWKGRNLIETDFDDKRGLKLGQFQALDFFGDGSFYLINAPGHALGHVMGLARTSPDPATFILMGADVAHQGGELRPTHFKPLPKHIEPNPLVAPFSGWISPCLGELFQAIHPKKSTTEPFMQATGFIHDDAATACVSIEKVLEFDAQDNIFTVIAHDRSVLDVIDFYPKTANDWKERGWKEQSFWRFLRDFDTGSGLPQ